MIYCADLTPRSIKEILTSQLQVQAVVYSEFYANLGWQVYQWKFEITTCIRYHPNQSGDKEKC